MTIMMCMFAICEILSFYYFAIERSAIGTIIFIIAGIFPLLFSLLSEGAMLKRISELEKKVEELKK